jgi:hypothetical protein
MEPEPRGPSGPLDLQRLRIDILRRAVALYLALAYPDSSPPEVVRRRLEWAPDDDAGTMLAKPPFERASKASGGASPIFALRLGNAHYPHMKLQVQPWPNEAGFMLSVNTHDQVLALDPNAEDAAAFRALQAENQRIKEAIEHAWDRDGLPTFLNYLRQYIEARSGAAAAPSGDAPASA